MSVSMYRGQVDRLLREVAALEKKMAGERSYATRARGDALRVSNTISSSTSESMLRLKLRNVQRYEKKAAGHDKRVAQLSDQVATKRHSLTSAQSSLERAEVQVRQKEDRAAKKRREEELHHIRDLERVRRTTTDPFPVDAHLLGTRIAHGSVVLEEAELEFEYDVCLSFAGENRDYVEMVARGLQARGVRVFYDVDEKAKLWGKNLTEHFDRIYRKASHYCVMFISEHYARKPWTRHERRSALARALEEEQEYILPARFDDTELEGLPPTVAYLDLTEVAPATLVEHVLEKLNVSIG